MDFVLVGFRLDVPWDVSVAMDDAALATFWESSNRPSMEGKLDASWLKYDMGVKRVSRDHESGTVSEGVKCRAVEKSGLEKPLYLIMHKRYFSQSVLARKEVREYPGLRLMTKERR
jgi:hypothetical protein